MGAFTITVSRDSRPVLLIDDDAPQRNDVDYHEGEEACALVLGYPYDDRIPRWLRAGEILADYTARGMEALDRIHGYFTLVIEDRAAGKCFVALDRFSGYDVFYARGGDSIIISDSVEAIASHLPRLHLDRPGAVQYLQFGFMLGDRTHFEEIRKFGPATAREVTGDLMMKAQTYWSPDDGGEIVAEGNVVETFNRHIRDALLLSDEVAIPLTGGLDSRAILSACLPDRNHLHCYTIGNPSNTDVRTARTVCRAAGVPFRAYPVDRECVEKSLYDNSSLASACNSAVNYILFHPFEMTYIDQGQSRDMLLPGIGSEMLRSFILREKQVGGSPPADVASLIARKFIVNKTPGLISGLDQMTGSQSAEALIREEVQASGITDPLRASEWFYLNNRIANWASTGFGVAGRHIRLWDSWLYSPILEAAGRIGSKSKTESLIQRRVIECNSKALANIPANGRKVTVGRGTTGSLTRSAAYEMREFTRKAVNLLSRAAIGSELMKTYFFIEYTELLSRYHRDFVRGCLRHDDMMLADLVDRDVLESTLDSLFHGGSSACYVVTNMMCAELWLKRVSGLTNVVI